MSEQRAQSMAGEPAGVAARWDRFVACNDVGCPGCGYNLRGLDGRKCPECGGRIDPAAIMFAGPDDLSFRAIVRHTGVIGALAVGLAAHIVGVVAAPGLFGHFLVAGATRSGVGSLDLILSSALLVVAGFAWARRRAGVHRPVRGGTDVLLQQGVAWVCWSLALTKAGLVGAMVVVIVLVA